MTDRRRRAEELARSADPLRWFETLYAEAGDDLSAVPWADLVANPHLLEWLETDAGRRVSPPLDRPADEHAPRALVVGCGVGDDAEELARRGFSTVAFDIAERAIEHCRRRFPDSPVEYRAANLLNPPPEWIEAFDLVFEAYTLQVLPDSMRRLALASLARFPRRGGSLLVICRARDADEPVTGFPWPLTRAELDPLTAPRPADADPPKLWEASFEDFPDAEVPPVRRFRLEARRAEDRAVRRDEE